MRKALSVLFAAFLVVSCGSDDPKKEKKDQDQQDPGFNLVQSCDTASGMTVVGGKCVPAKVWIKRGGLVEVGSVDTDLRSLVANLPNATFEVRPAYAELRDSGDNIYYGLEGTTEQQHPGIILMPGETRGSLDYFMLYNQINISMRPKVDLNLFGLDLPRDGQQLEVIESSCRNLARETGNAIVGTFGKRDQDYTYECRTKEVVSEAGRTIYGNVIWACYPRGQTCYFMSTSPSLLPPRII